MRYRYLIVSLFLCGIGRAEGLLSQQPGKVVPAGTWTNLTAPAGYIPAVDSGWSKMGYVPALGQGCMLVRGYRDIGTEPDRSWACYSFAEHRWNILENNSPWHDDTNPEAGHQVAGLNVDPVSSVFYGPCCYSLANESDKVNWFWVFDPVGGVGRAKQMFGAAGTPTKLNLNVTQTGGAYDPVNQRIIFFGGDGGPQATSEYNPATNTLVANITTTGASPPPGLSEPSMAFNSRDGKVYVFGGRSGATYQNAIYRYNQPTSTWETLAPTGTPPLGRYKVGFVYVSSLNVFVVYGGTNEITVYNDTFVYDPVANTWSQPTLTTSPPAPAGAIHERMYYSPEDDVIIAADITTLGSQQDASVWALRLSGMAGQNAGYRSQTYSASAGTLNRLGNTTTAQTWAQGGSVAANGATVYQGWQEIGPPGDLTNVKFFHSYIQSMTGSTATNLGANYYSFIGDSWFGAVDGVGNGTTTFTSANGLFNSGYCNAGSCAGFQINIAGLGTFTIASVTTTNSVVLSGTVPTGTGYAYFVPGASGAGGTSPEHADIAVTVVGSTPWACAGQQDLGNFGLTKVQCRGWDGSAWSIGGLIARGSSTNSPYYQGKPQIANVNGKPTVGFTEQFRDVIPYHHYAYVEQWNGTSFVVLGGALNVAGDVSNIAQVDNVSVASDGTNPFAAWSEFTTVYTSTYGSDSAPQVYLKRWNGANWDLWCATSANITGTDGAYNPAVVYLGGQPYVAFQERTVAGNARLVVRTCPSQGGAWSTVVADLRRDQNNGWAYAPKMTQDGTNLVIAWSEQGNPQGWVAQASFGQKPQIHAAKITAGGLVAYLGGSANMDTAAGAATHPAIAMAGSAPVLLIGEIKPGSLRQIYSKQWNGTDWVGLSAQLTAGTALSGSVARSGKTAIQ